MHLRSFEFNRRELAGALGDFGTFVPLALGYITVCGLDPAGLLVMMGLVNIGLGFVYKIPVPLQPMKVIAVVAIAQQWTPAMVYASGFTMGIVLLLLVATGIMGWIARITPDPVTRGIQVALGVLLILKAVKLFAGAWPLAVGACVLVFVLRRNRHAPASVVLVLLGISIMAVTGRLAGVGIPVFSLPALTGFAWHDVQATFLPGAFAQVPLTVTNAVIATAALIKTYWPDRAVPERNLTASMAVINLLVPFAGGMPMCHGAGGLAGQYYFGARSGGAKIIEGVLELALGLCLAQYLAGLFAAFPRAIIGAMLLFVGLELSRFGREAVNRKELGTLLVTVVVASCINMGVGFLAGLAVHYSLARKR